MEWSKYLPGHLFGYTCINSSVNLYINHTVGQIFGRYHVRSPFFGGQCQPCRLFKGSGTIGSIPQRRQTSLKNLQEMSNNHKGDIFAGGNSWSESISDQGDYPATGWNIAGESDVSPITTVFLVEPNRLIYCMKSWRPWRRLGITPKHSKKYVCQWVLTRP